MLSVASHSFPDDTESGLELLRLLGYRSTVGAYAKRRYRRIAERRQVNAL